MRLYEATLYERSDKYMDPQPVMCAAGGVPMFDDPQEIANRAWKQLAGEMGFVWDSACAGPNDRSFYAQEV